jgi:hypothetical protein
MGIAWRVAIGVAGVSLVFGVLVRFHVADWARIASPSAFLRFTDTCLLVAIAFLLAEILRTRRAGAGEEENAPRESD